MKKIKFYLSSLSFAILGALMSAVPAKAAFDFGNINPIFIKQTDTGIAGFLSSVVNVVLIIVSIVAILFLIWGGVQYITAGGDADKASKGRVTITNAIIGIIIILAAFLIYNATVNIGSGTLQ